MRLTAPLAQVWRSGAAVAVVWLAPALCASCEASQAAAPAETAPHHDAGTTPLPEVDSSLPSLVPARCEGGTASAAEARIDDLADGDGLILPVDGRNGRWAVSNDGTGLQTPRARSSLLPEPFSFDGGDSYAVHTSGSGFTGWGAAVGFAFQSDDGLLCQYNAKLYQGIAFRVRGSGQLRVELSVPETLPAVEGGVCTGEGCDNRHGFPIELSSAWREYRLGFDQFAQESGWGQPAQFDASRLLGLRFRAPEQAAFDLWIDEVRFFPDLAPADAGLDASSAPLDGG